MQDNKAKVAILEQLNGLDDTPKKPTFYEMLIANLKENGQEVKPLKHGYIGATKPSEPI